MVFQCIGLMHDSQWEDKVAKRSIEGGRHDRGGGDLGRGDMDP